EIRTRESILHIPRICGLISEQIALLDKIRNLKNEAEDPRTYAYALFCGLIVKQGFEMVLKRSIDSALKDTLYDVALDRDFPEYETFLGFRKILELDEKRRSEIAQFRTELLRRIGGGSPEKAEALERIDTVIQLYSSILPKIQERYDRAQIDKRKEWKDKIDFYTSVVSVISRDKDSYLS
ncbi:MAG: hypothetical protein LBH09_05455, partial [Peptococcaceae bacterium]|nr:hypothetical protein [Peptococcaceae bacterium]